MIFNLFCFTKWSQITCFLKSINMEEQKTQKDLSLKTTQTRFCFRSNSFVRHVFRIHFINHNRFQISFGPVFQNFEIGIRYYDCKIKVWRLVSRLGIGKWNRELESGLGIEIVSRIIRIPTWYLYRHQSGNNCPFIIDYNF